MANDEKDPKDEAPDTNGAGSSVVDALKSKELLGAAIASAAGAVAAAKGPDLVRKLTSETEEKGQEEAEQLGKSAAEGAKQSIKGGAGGVVGKTLSKALGGGGSGGKKTRRLPIQRWTDVAVPVDKAFEAWTKFDQYPKFMHRVLSVEQKGKNRVSWQEKIWFSSREWEGEITERRENDRIAWKTKSGMSHKGVVSFHKLDDRLTRVMVDMEFEPNGMIEKMASGLRFVKRAVQADLARYKAFVEMDDAKGIEYRSAREDSEQEGQGQQQSRNDSKSDDERESDRQDRESRRQERREQAGAR